MRIRFLLLSVLVLGGLIPVHAQVASSSGDSAYSVSVPISDTSDAQRNHAFAVALGGILARTGGQQLTGAPGFTDALGSAANLVQNYQYARAPAGSHQAFMLNVQFDPAAVKLLAAGLQKQLTQAAPAVAGSAAAPLVARVWVAPLHSAMDMAQLLSTVRADSQVREAEPVGAAGDGVMLQIRSSDGLPSLLAALQAGGHLHSDAMLHPGADASLRWTH